MGGKSLTRHGLETDWTCDYIGLTAAVRFLGLCELKIVQVIDMKRRRIREMVIDIIIGDKAMSRSLGSSAHPVYLSAPLLWGQSPPLWAPNRIDRLASFPHI